MSDRFRPLGAERLAGWIAGELEHLDSILGIPRELWFRPSAGDRFAFRLRGKHVETPIGVAAGPHTQLAQNIVVSWLCGARIIELKTVQCLDRIEVAKPCIDMADEGYNIEWSQELTVRESFDEYLTAWVLVHALHRRLDLPGEKPGVLFDLSVGYDLEGIRRSKIEWFLEHMKDAGDELERTKTEISRFFPEVFDLDIPTELSDSVTLSTLHGCPPEEIGAIVEHLLDTWQLHTAVKLNPTLLGYDTVREVLVEILGWTNVEPHQPSFAADIGYADALALLQRLQESAGDRGLDFGIKLCNTLPVANRRPTFDRGEATAYLSGRPLHALAVELARRLSNETAGRLPISFAGGADAFNTPALLASGLRPVTTCSDLLRVGGYLRLRQYLEEIDAAFDIRGAVDLDDLIIKTADGPTEIDEAARQNLRHYADGIGAQPELHRATYRRNHTKTTRDLGLFDCIEAPCTDACSVNQRVPAYMRDVAAGDIAGASRVIREDNPLPSILGRACHHPCEPVCLRSHLDQPVAIREIKRFVTDHADPVLSTTGSASCGDLHTAIIGAGPCGLAAAAELARAGVRVVIYEARNEGGGMVSATIPGYRASSAAVQRDLSAIMALGVECRFGVSVGTELSLDEIFGLGFTSIVIAVGAQRGLRLGIDGEDATGVLDGLDFLRAARHQVPETLGERIAVIGGGDVAMDCARTARRITGGAVEILYRRSLDQMPAHPEEIRDLLAEGISIRELVAPRRIVEEEGRLLAVECALMTLGDADASGRPRPVEIAGESIAIELDNLIIAIGQSADLGVFGDSPAECASSGYLRVDPETLETSIPGVFAGGDLRDPGPSSIVDACGDGKTIARAILEREGLAKPTPSAGVTPIIGLPDLLRRRSHREPRVEIPRSCDPNLSTFDEVVETLDGDSAATEAGRCLDCDLLCSTCDGVCPNRAILTYRLHPSREFIPAKEGPNAGRAGSEGPKEGLEVVQEPQVAVVADLCNECGNCATFCPTVGRPYLDKPRIFFHRGDFESETDNAFMLLIIGGRPGIQGRFQGKTHQLVMYGGPANGTTGSTPESAIMLTLLQGLTESMPHLPIPDAEPEWIINLG